MLKWLAGLAMAALLLMSPEAAVNGAREAMAQWVYAVAPALFPFMALLPLLTCEAALEVYERLLGGLTRRLYDLPGGAAPALAVGMLAGSPAGCAAVKRVAARTPMTRGQARRLAVACCGLSPAFLITGIGAALLGDVGCGHILLRSQIAAQLTLPLLLRPLCRDSTPMSVREAEDAARLRAFDDVPFFTAALFFLPAEPEDACLPFVFFLVVEAIRSVHPLSSIPYGPGGHHAGISPSPARPDP